MTRPLWIERGRKAPADPPRALFLSSQGGRRAGAGKHPSQRAVEAGALQEAARSPLPVAFPWLSAGLCQPSRGLCIL